MDHVNGAGNGASPQIRTAERIAQAVYEACWTGEPLSLLVILDSGLSEVELRTAVQSVLDMRGVVGVGLVTAATRGQASQ